MARKPKAKSSKLDLRTQTIPSNAPINVRDQMEAGMADETKGLLPEMRKNLNDAWDFWRPIYRMSREDVSFAYDDQWPAYAKKQRKNRVMLTMNMTAEYINQVVGQARKSKFSIRVAQLSGRNTQIFSTDGRSHYSRAQAMEGIIRDIERRSRADRKYVRALQHSVEGGIGWLWVHTVRPEDDPFNIELRVRHVQDRYSVCMDPFVEEDDFSDARYCAISEDIPEDEFKARWPDVPPSAWEPDGTGRRAEEGTYWGSRSREVKVVDYFWKEACEREALLLVKRDEQTGEFNRLVVYRDEVDDVLDEMKEEGFQQIENQKLDTYKVMYMRCLSNYILEEPTDWPSMFLPSVPVIGRQIDMANRHLLCGLTRFSKDPQRMYNFWASAATEKMALAPKSPYLLTPRMIAGHEALWDSLQNKNQPYLLYNDETEEGRSTPIRQDMSSFAAGELQMLQQAKAALQDSIGLHDASLGRRSNEVSGVAINQRAERGENSVFDFLDNLARAVENVGTILADMIPRIYTNEVAQSLVMPDDSTSEVVLNRVVKDRQTEKEFKINTLDYARYSVWARVGPESTTQREQFVQMMLEWGRSDPEGFQMFRDLIIDQMDIPNGRMISERMKKLVPPNLLSEEDRQNMGQEQQQPTPEQQLQQLELQVRQAEAQAKMAKAQSDVEVARLRVEADQARTGFEVEKGINRQEEDARRSRDKDMQEARNNTDDDGVTMQEVQAIVKRAVAEALAGRR